MFCTFWLLRNFYSGDAHRAHYAKPSLRHHFHHSAHCVYQIYRVLKLFEITVCFEHFGFYEISTPVARTRLTMPNIVLIIISDIAQTGYIRLTAFSIFSKLLFVLHILPLRNFNSGDAHHSNYCELCLNHHCFHCSHCVNKIYSVFKLFEFAFSFAHFGFYEISTPVMRTMLPIANIIYINISNTP